MRGRHQPIDVWVACLDSPTPTPCTHLPSPQHPRRPTEQMFSHACRILIQGFQFLYQKHIPMGCKMTKNEKKQKQSCFRGAIQIELSEVRFFFFFTLDSTYCFYSLLRRKLQKEKKKIQYGMCVPRKEISS